MKTRLLLCIVVIGILSAYKKAEPNSTAPQRCTAAAGNSSQKHLSRGNAQVMANVLFSLVQARRKHAPGPRTIASRPTALDSVTKLLRLKLYIDQYNYDDIAIGFNSGASVAYNFNEDSRYLPGIDAAEGLSCLSSDGVALSIDLLPLPKQSFDVIRLDVETQSSRTITLKRTQLDSLPKDYNLWLVDNYKKDSVNLRVDSNYVFTINKSDTATFGAWRFKVVVSRNPAPAFQLVSFSAAKASTGAEIAWTTQNEGDNTRFAIERSIDDGTTFAVLDSLVSDGKGSYSFTDNTPPNTSDEYRVKVTGANGTVSYSNVVTLLYSVSPPPIANAISVYPNPTNGMINLTINQNNSENSLAAPGIAPLAATLNTTAASYNIRIVNISGTTIRSAVSSTGNWQDNVSNLLAGTYIITVVDNSNNKLVGRSTFVKL